MRRLRPLLAALLLLTIVEFSTSACVDDCNGAGVCDMDDICVCNPGFAGPTCQFSNAITCNGAGIAQDDGSCTCNWAFAGPACQFSNAITCSGLGTAQNDGSCDCIQGHAGPACQYSDAVTCNGFGVALDDGRCQCNQGFRPPACDSCSPSYFSYPICRFCNAGQTCNGRGSCTPSGTCSCLTRYTGAACEQCIPEAVQNYPYCDYCTPDWPCSGHGTCNSTHHCVCNAGWTTSLFELSIAPEKRNWCDTCAPGYYGENCLPCPGLLPDGTVCNGRGFCDQGPIGSGTCLCDGINNGPGCEYTPANTCTNHGRPTYTGGCSCYSGFKGAVCDSCNTNHYNYPTCRYCVASHSCSGRGVCDEFGYCICEPIYQLLRLPSSQPDCSICIADRYEYPICRYCLASETCSGHGTCKTNGFCVCSGYNTGAACNECPVNYFGNVCKLCPPGDSRIPVCGGPAIGFCDEGYHGTGLCLPDS